MERKQKMNMITYASTSELLHVKMETIKQAVSKGNLTRCLLKGKTALLILEQVLLFDGKKISVRDLSFEDRKKWELYKRIAENPVLLRQSGFSDEEALEIFDAKDVRLTGRKLDEVNKAMLDILRGCGIEVPPELETVHP